MRNSRQGQQLQTCSVEARDGRMLDAGRASCVGGDVVVVISQLLRPQSASVGTDNQEVEIKTPVGSSL